MLVVVFLFICVLRPVTAIRLDGNGYSDILIVISPAVPENEELLNQIKVMVTSGSECLFEALDHKVFFKDVKILVPPKWTSGKYERARTETFNKGRIRIDSPHHAVGDDPYTHQTSVCGREGEYINFTPNFLLNDTVSQAFGPKGRVFVHEWAHLRWGVFDEYNVREPFYLSSGQILPTRCNDKVAGQWYEIINERPRRCQIGGDGKPTSNLGGASYKIKFPPKTPRFLISTKTVKMLVVVFLFICVLRPVTAIRLDGNGYSDILIVISPAVAENEELLNQIKVMVTSGSEYLCEALDRKVFFKDVKILVPPKWTSGKYERARTETFNKGRIRIDSPNYAVGDDPYTHQTSVCGREGEYIHFTPNFLLNDTVRQEFGPKGRVFVHEWAHLRWGVFDEYNVREPFYLSSGQILPRCNDKVAGQWYEIIKERHRRCQIVGHGKPSSKFFPDEKQHTNSSIMFIPALDSVRAFCHEEEHNTDAPNEQNQKCAKATRTVIFQDSVDKDALQNLKPLQSAPPAPTFKIIQRGPRTVCLVLDVSGSMDGSRIKLQQQAATVFLNQIINEQEFVALVTFSTEAQILNPLTLIDGKASRDRLINKLPTTAAGKTYICKGLRKGLEALQKDDGKTIGDEILFLTDGEATDNVQECFQEAVQSGAIIHTIAFGPKADNVLKTMSDQTDGKFIVAGESISSNQLVDAFSSVTIFDGDSITQPVQIESIGKNVDDWFNGTVTVDWTIGNHTTFTLIYERTAPMVYIESPSGLVYDQRSTTDIANTITFIVTGTAEPGDWKYSFFNKHKTTQQMSLTVMSRAAREDVYPVTVTVRMSQQTSDGIDTMIALAELRQKYNPVMKASVQVNLDSDTGNSKKLQLLDNGAGADAFKDDGIYSRYFTEFKRGKYTIRVRVEIHSGGVQVSPHRYSGALYVPGYIVDGEVKLNPPKPPVTVQPVDVGSLTRTATGESFVVKADAPSNLPPNKITDLIAGLQEDIVFLNWTAPGEDLDQGTAQSYEIRWSEDFKMLQKNFNNSNLVNTSTLQPQESGSAEQHSFQLSILIKNGTTLFIAVLAVDKDSVKSQVSNIARATYHVPIPRPSPTLNLGLNLTAITVSLCVVTITVCLIAVIITQAQKGTRHRHVIT